ncbi:probable clathrin assembly protein At4g32285 [Primulina huaijiensis]|uniref:probable clathrin assembly protein At4g32285 n=1 Tax=Primulina huaijiensis TaxID=1492673 RepID=UPI003CC7142F
MASSTVRKAIGAVKDHTSISLAKVTGNVAPDLEVLIVKATTHENEPADDKYVREISNMLSHSRGYVIVCVSAISKRLRKTRDWVVAVKTLMLVNRLLSDGDPVFGQEIMLASRKGTRVLNLSDFRDEAHSSSWEHSGFVRNYALYLDQKLDFMMCERKPSDFHGEKKRYGYGELRDQARYDTDRRLRSYGDLNEMQTERKEVTPDGEMEPWRILERLIQLLQILDRLLASKPTGAAKNSRMVLVALSLIVKDSFRLYADASNSLNFLLDHFLELEYASSVKAFDLYVNASKIFYELVVFYGWCKDIGVLRSSEFPEVEKITDKLLGTLEGFLREKANRPKSTEEIKEEVFTEIKEEKGPDIYEIKALPPPEYYNSPTMLQSLDEPKQHVTGDLVNLKDAISADEYGNKLALSFFSAPAPAVKNDAWEEFSTDGEPVLTSAWQNPAAESGKADWELALVESASHLSQQKANLAGGFDSLLLSGMYDQGSIRQQTNNSEMNVGSSSSVSLPLTSKHMPVLALPAPDGTVQPVVQQDPFAASLCVPPPSYVQIADMEKKQVLLTQEQRLWQQYASNGMQGQMVLANIAGTASYYGTPQATVLGAPAGYYYSPY